MLSSTQPGVAFSDDFQAERDVAIARTDLFRVTTAATGSDA